MGNEDARTRRRAGTAFHEAGHAVACVVLRRSLTRVTVVATEDAWGRAQHPRRGGASDSRLEEASYSGPGGLDMPARTRRWVEREVIIALSGAIAEAKATGDEEEANRGGGIWGLPDDEAARLSELAGGPVTHGLSYGSDYQLAFDLLEKVTAGDDEEASAWEGWLTIRARKLIDFYWPEVQAVAAVPPREGTGVVPPAGIEPAHAV